MKELYSRKTICNMNIYLISNALDEAYSLIYNEQESVCDDSLMQEYEETILLLENAINEIKAAFTKEEETKE